MLHDSVGDDTSELHSKLKSFIVSDNLIVGNIATDG